MSLPFYRKYPYQNDEILNLDWILTQIEEFRATLESWESTIQELKEALENLEGWENRIEALEKIAAKIPSIEKSLNDIINLEAADVKTLRAMIEDLQDQINSLDISALRVYVDSRFNETMADYNKKIYDNYVVTYELFNGLKDRIIELSNIIAELDTKAYNPWARTLQKESLQNNLNYAYADLADNVPTAEEYSELGLSANEYNSYGMLARDYSVRGRKILRLDFVYSPVYGFKQNINNVFTSIVNFIKGTMSANDYTALDLDADAYTALDLTAEEYYSYNNTYGLLALGGEGLTASQYATIHQI